MSESPSARGLSYADYLEAQDKEKGFLPLDEALYIGYEVKPEVDRLWELTQKVDPNQSILRQLARPILHFRIGERRAAVKNSVIDAEIRLDQQRAADEYMLSKQFMSKAETRARQDPQLKKIADDLANYRSLTTVEKLQAPYSRPVEIMNDIAKLIAPQKKTYDKPKQYTEHVLGIIGNKPNKAFRQVHQVCTLLGIDPSMLDLSKVDGKLPNDFRLDLNGTFTIARRMFNSEDEEMRLRYSIYYQPASRVNIGDEDYYHPAKIVLRTSRLKK